MLTLWEELSSETLDAGPLIPASRGSGMFFTKLGSPASTRPVSTGPAWLLTRARASAHQ
jgi:hypothetical protein